MSVDAQIEERDLIGIGLTEQEKQVVLSSTNPEERVRLLRRSRGRLLDDLHERQQTLDRLDYLIYQLRKNGKVR